MLHFVLWLAYLIKSSKAIKVGGKKKPYKMSQAGISLAASPLAKSLAGFMAALLPRARPLTNPASYAGYPSVKTTVDTLIDVRNETSKHHFLKSVSLSLK